MADRGPVRQGVVAALLLATFALAAQEEKPAPPAQPVSYSHKAHLARGLTCKDCHPNPDPGDRMTLPAASKCMACHATVASDRPMIQKLAELAKSKQPIAWVRVYSVAAGVYWSHRSHLEAGIKCDACHGQVAQMEVMTKAKDVTTMQGCIDCHRLSKAETGCQFCHEGK